MGTSLTDGRASLLGHTDDIVRARPPHTPQRPEADLAAGTRDHTTTVCPPGCVHTPCASCNGSGGDMTGPCWDCRTEGFTHSPTATSSDEHTLAPGLRSNSSRNVVDKYKAWETEQIIADLETRRTALVNVCVNLTGDFNKAAIIRANNAFTGARVIITERRRYDKRGTVGTHHYEHVDYAEDTLGVIAALIAEGYTVFPVDNTPEFGPQPIMATALPAKTAFLYGEEGPGLPGEFVAACNGNPVYIPQHGSVRSLNVGQAAAIAMFAYDIQHPRNDLFGEESA